MIRLVPYKKFEFDDDVNRIVEICADAGYVVSREDAAKIWELYSESMAAGWMALQDNEHVLKTVLSNSFPMADYDADYDAGDVPIAVKIKAAIANWNTKDGLPLLNKNQVNRHKQERK